MGNLLERGAVCGLLVTLGACRQTAPDAMEGTAGVDSVSGSSGSDGADGAADGGDGDGATDGPACPGGEIECGDVCCGQLEVCSEGVCAEDCGADDPCGPDRVCCDDGELCYLGSCVVPAGACENNGCATQIDDSSCGEGYVCDDGFAQCVPSLANPACEYIPPAAEFSPRPLFTWGTRGEFACQVDADCQTAETCSGGLCAATWPHIDPEASPENVHSSSIPVVADLDGDCTPEVIFNTYITTTITTQGVMRAVRGDTGEPVWSVTDPDFQSNSTANPAVGDIDDDGLPEVIVAGAGKYLVAIDSDGTPMWKSDTFLSANASGSVAIANMDNAGGAELVFGSAIIDNTGALLWEGGAGQGRDGQGPISCVADLDGDGRPELIGGHTAYTTSGSVAGGDFAGEVLWQSSIGDGRCGVADFDGDGLPEVIVVEKGNMHALDGQTGLPIATFVIPGTDDGGGAPNIADFDGDGVPDVGTAGSGFYVVVQFNGESFTEMWRAATEDDSSRVTGSSVFDFDGDGSNEVIYNDEQFIRIYPGVEPDCQTEPPGPGCNGIMEEDEVLFADINSSRTRTEYPVVADVDGDFKAELVFSTNSDVNWGRDAGIEVWEDALDNWVGTRPVWNQHSYHVTNVGIDGSIPKTEDDAWSVGFNGYRRNAQGASNYCAPDLALFDLRVDQQACPGLVISVDVANIGCLGVGPGVQVSIYEETLGLLGTVSTTGQLPAGGKEVVTLDAMEELVGARLWAIVDDDGMGNGVLNECDEDNESDPIEVCFQEG